MNLASNNDATHRFGNQPVRFTFVDLGIGPAKNVAKVAVEKGVPRQVEFSGHNLATCWCMEGKQNIGETYAYSSDR